VLAGADIAAGIFVMWNRYREAIQNDMAGNTGGTNALKWLQTDVQAIAAVNGIAMLGAGPRRGVGALGRGLVALELGNMLFGGPSIQDRYDQWRLDQPFIDPHTGREVRRMESEDYVGYSPWHVKDSKTGQWAPARDYFGPYLTEREIQAISDPWR
jgi:hypothetical protein